MSFKNLRRKESRTNDRTKDAPQNVEEKVKALPRSSQDAAGILKSPQASQPVGEEMLPSLQVIEEKEVPLIEDKMIRKPQSSQGVQEQMPYFLQDVKDEIREVPQYSQIVTIDEITAKPQFSQAVNEEIPQSLGFIETIETPLSLRVIEEKTPDPRPNADVFAEEDDENNNCVDMLVFCFLQFLSPFIACLYFRNRNRL